MAGSASRLPIHVPAALALISASLLAWQVLLTRVCALRLHFHFGFLVISNCLLGFAASGTLLFLLERRWRGAARLWATWIAAAYVAVLPLCWVLVRKLPVPDTLEFRGAGELIQFSTFNLLLALPFLIGGGVVGLLLSAHAERVHAAYAADLAGAAVGAVICPWLLWHTGAGGTFIVVLTLGVLTLVVLIPRGTAALRWGVALGACLVGVLLAPRLDGWFPIPGKGAMDLTRDLRTPLSPYPVYSRWSANSRIDLLEHPPKLRFIYGRDAKLFATPLPAEQMLILQDGDAATLISNFTEQPAALEHVERSLYSLGLSLKPKARVMVIGMGGGNDVWAAVHAGAKSVRAVELNQAIVDIHREILPRYSAGLLNHPGVELVVDEGRSALMRDRGEYDVIQMTGIDTWTSLSSGAYVLAENYLYTSDAFTLALERLAPGGILKLTRMAAEMETLRLLVNLEAAWKRVGETHFEQGVVCFATQDFLMTTLVKRGGFSPGELDELWAFAERNSILPVYMPGRQVPRENLIDQYMKGVDRSAFVEAFPRDISETTDDKPYFFNFNRWRAPIESVKHIREPTMVSQGNPFFLLTQLAIATVLALAFVLAPLWLRRRKPIERDPDRPQPMARRRTAAFLAYFTAIGVGFIAIEIALIQKLTLLLGQPLYSIVVTLTAILLFMGLGSFASERLVATTRRAWGIPAFILLWSGLVVWLGPTVVAATIGGETWLRVVTAVGFVAPVAFALGMPFAHGVRILRVEAPSFVPWAWAVNGAATVVGSIGTVIVSMNLGFSAVLLAAALLYVLGFVVLGRGKGELGQSTSTAT